MGRLPGGDAPPTRSPSRCACSCRAARRGSRGRPSTRSGTARSARCSPPAPSTCRAIRPGDVVLNSWAYGTHNGAFVVRRGPAPLAQLRRAHHRHGQRHQQRAPGRAGHRVRGRRDPDDRRLPAPPRRRRARDGLRPGDRLQRCTRCRTSATARCSRRRSVSSASTPTGSTRCSGCRWSARRTTGCTSSRTPSSCRSSTPRPGEPLPDGELGCDLHHRALQDRQPAVPLQHHGPVVPLPARAVRVRELAAQDGPVRGPRRQHGEAARRQRLARGRRRARARGRRGRARLVRTGGAATSDRDELVALGGQRARPVRLPGDRRPRSRRGSRTASACASRSRWSRRARSTRGPRSTCRPS